MATAAMIWLEFKGKFIFVKVAGKFGRGTQHAIQTRASPICAFCTCKQTSIQPGAYAYGRFLPSSTS